MIVLAVLGYTLLYMSLILFAFLLMLLFVPIRYNSWGMASDGGFALMARFSWLFGMIRVQYSLNRSEGHGIQLRIFRLFKKDLTKLIKHFKQKEASGEKEKREAKAKEKRPFDKEKLVVVLKGAKNVIKACKPRYLKLEARAGFEDACHTGLLCAGFQILYPALKNAGTIRFSPAFDEEVFEGAYELEGQMMMGVLALEGLRLFFSKPFRKNKNKY